MAAAQLEVSSVVVLYAIGHVSTLAQPLRINPFFAGSAIVEDVQFRKDPVESCAGPACCGDGYPW